MIFLKKDGNFDLPEVRYTLIFQKGYNKQCGLLIKKSGIICFNKEEQGAEAAVEIKLLNN